MGRNVVFVGTYPMPPDSFPLADDLEIWTANEASRALPEGRKASRVFQLHPRNWREAERIYLHNGYVLPPHLDEDCFGRNNEHVKYLRTCGVPVYGQQLWEDIPTSVRYPFEAVTEAVGVQLPPNGTRRLWATSTWGYMAALLIMHQRNVHDGKGGEPVQSVHLYGAELPMGSGRERYWEWPNFAYYLGMMAASGISVVVPRCGSSLLSAPHYARGGHPYPGEADHWFYPGAPGTVNDLEDGTYHLGTRYTPAVPFEVKAEAKDAEAVCP